VSLARVVPVVRKEVREFKRNRFVISTMAVLPLIFLITPMITLFKIPDSASGTQVERAVGLISLLFLIVPIVIPPVISSYSVVGERVQGTLEPVLTTPVRRDELLLGKATAAFVPSVLIAYAIYFIAAISVRLWAAPVVRAVVWHAPQMVAQLLFIPLLAAWSIWVGLGISTRASDVRVAQQLSLLASLPAVLVVVLIALDVIPPSPELGVALAVLLIVLDVGGWQVTSWLFDRERLIAGTRD
jgi:ABC-2 type transport system permease protein